MKVGRGACFLFVLIVGLTAFAQSVSAAVLTHRYSFDQDARDLVVGADGVLRGNAYVANGAINLDGSTNSFMELPRNLFTNYDSISFEIWFADSGTNRVTTALFYFGGDQGGMRFSLSGLNPPPVGGTNHLIWVLDTATLRIYVNGLLAIETTNTLSPASIGSTSYNYIGAAQNNGSTFSGNILEFRSYLGAMSPLEAAVAEASGPDQPPVNPGAPKALRVSPPSVGPGALIRTSVFADFENLTNVNISTVPDLLLTSDNENVIVFDPDHKMRTVGLGTANVTAIYQGLSNTVSAVVGLPQDASLIHRYSFSELTNDWIVHDSIGKAHGEVFSTLNTVVNGAFTGNGQLKVGPNSSSYVTLPSGLISCLSEVSIEAWITWTVRNSWPWERVFDFGSSSGGRGTNYFFLTTEANTWITGRQDVARVTIATNTLNEFPRLDWTNTLPLRTPCHVAVTYSPPRGIAKFYINGKLVAADAASIPLSAIQDISNFLGKSQFSQDSYFIGSYDEFRIYSGILQDSEIARDYTAGPDTIAGLTPGPQVSTLLADASLYTTTLKAAVNPNGLPTSVFFNYGTNSGYGGTTAITNIGDGTSLSAVSLPINDLTPLTTYHFQCVAANSAATNFGGDVVFTTPDIVSNSPAQSIGMKVATLNGLVCPAGLPTESWFEYGTNTQNLTATPRISLNGGTEFVPQSATISDLPLNTQYYFRIVATNSIGTRYSAFARFTTLPPLANKPSIVGMPGLDGNTFTVQFTTQAGSSYTLQLSTNLIDWLDVTNINVFTNGATELRDSTAPDARPHFYRLRSP